MKKKINPIMVAIIVLIIILGIIIYLYVKPTNSTSSVTSTSSSSSSLTEVSSSIQTIENTLSSSGEIASALDEKLSLHASYYFEELLVDENVYIEEGTNIVEYTNGTYLTAPYNCVIVSTNLPNEDEVCTTSHYIEIKSIDSLSMNLSVSETDINKIEIGDAVDITITATEEKIEGYITSISEVGSYSSSGSYFTAQVTFENNGNLKIGMSATCEIIIEKAENVVAVPLEAIQTSDDGKYVIVVNKDGSTSNVSVETGISNDAYIEIKSGISENTTVQMSESSSSTSTSKGGFSGGKEGNMNNGGGGFSPTGGAGGGGEMPSMPGGMQ
jgi:multidrug efflux pump subunit AcrA (membrane-fusion protein)